MGFSVREGRDGGSFFVVEGVGESFEVVVRVRDGVEEESEESFREVYEWVEVFV